MGMNRKTGTIVTTTLRNAAIYATKETFSFKAWLKLLDSYMEGWVGLGHDHFADRCWKDAYNDELSPMEAIESFYGTTTDVALFWHTESYGM
jgi:hypothetical protein